MAGLGAEMPAIRSHGAPHLRPRSTAAIVLTRPDPRPAGGKSAPPGGDPKGAGGRSRWPVVLTWIVLGSAIAALWALLLIGDSLVVSG